MNKLRSLLPEDLAGGINVIDLGASGGVKPEWRPISHLINVMGFDPNANECERLNRLPSGYKNAKFLPYALAGESGQRTLYKTKSIYCWSLLHPRLEWLNRFTYSDLFTIEGTETIQVYRLDEVPELANVDIDAMKIDTQGIELPVLRGAGRMLEESIWIETETGLTQNYQGETTFDQMLHFMDAQGFGLFSLDANHSVARKNLLSKDSRREQLLWCEAIWLRDYYKSSSAQRDKLTRAKALKALCLYANHGCISFGLESAALFRDLGLIEGVEYDHLAQNDSWWRLPRKGHAFKRVIETTLDWVPRSYLSSLLSIITDLSNTRHPLKR